MKEVTLEIGGEEVILLADKAAFFPKHSTLIISDIHLGKSTHFRKAGIPLSAGAYHTDLKRMEELIKQTSPQTVVFLGDLFHSYHNVEWELFSQWLANYRNIEFILVEGNHDVLPVDIYERAGVVVKKFHRLNTIVLSHEPLKNNSGYNIYGHIHPGIKLYGKAYQSVKIACFHIGKNSMIMPAFGGLTGMYMMDVKADDLVYGIADLTLIKVK